MNIHTTRIVGLVRTAVLLLCPVVAFVGQELILRGSVSFDYTATIFGLDPLYRETSVDVTKQGVGLVLSILAGLLFGLAVPSKEIRWNLAVELKITRYEDSGCNSKRCWVSALFLSVSLVLCGLLFNYYKVGGESLVTRTLWFSSLAFFLFTLICLGAFSRSSLRHTHAPPFSPLSIFGLASICLIAFLLRVWNLENLPLTLTPDTAHIGTYALENRSERGWRLFGLGFAGNPQLAAVPATLSMAVWGENLFAVRFADVVLGTSMVLSTYLIVWRSLDSHRLAALASSLLAISMPHIHFSRHVCNIDPWALWGFGFFFLITALKGRFNALLGASGLLMGLALQMYLAGRLLLVMLPAFVFYLLLFHRKLVWDLRVGYLLFVVGFLVACTPNIADISAHTWEWKQSNRTDVTLLNSANLADYARREGAHNIFDVILTKIRTCLLLFQYSKDESGQTYFNYPFLDHALAPFMWLGVGLCITRGIGNPSLGMIFIVFFLSSFLYPALSPQSQAYWPRLGATMMTQSMLTAFGLSGFFFGIRGLLQRFFVLMRLRTSSSMRASQAIGCIAALALLVVVGVRGFRSYLHASSVDHNPASKLARALRAHTAPGTTICCIPWDSFRISHPEVQFLAHGRTFNQLPGDIDVHQAIQKCGSDTAVWAIHGRQVELKALLKQHYPNGQFIDTPLPETGLFFELFGTTGLPKDVRSN